MKDETSKLFKKAFHAIHAANILLKEGEIDFAAGRAYYAMFYTAKALLCEKDMRRFTKHTAVHGAFGEFFAKTEVLEPKFHRWLMDAFDKRITADYEVEMVVTSNEVKTMIQHANEFLEQAQKYLSQLSG